MVEGASVVDGKERLQSHYTWRDIFGCTSALYVYVVPAGTWLGYIEVLSIEYRRVRTADIMDSWAWQSLGSWIWRTLGVAIPRDGVEH